ncbi:hypothetical protein FGO68_gene9848 [Halteria grandinella]|uniref:Uncharacterized protein n=1 Tax=Halteria grandinella TaxID=5974 RepID=A0A8J8P051_HALGN|nr:hypothetical protein FGO68_gene9848 [Halteria grandinella]
MFLKYGSYFQHFPFHSFRATPLVSPWCSLAFCTFPGSGLHIAFDYSCLCGMTILSCQHLHHYFWVRENSSLNLQMNLYTGDHCTFRGHLLPCDNDYLSRRFLFLNSNFASNYSYERALRVFLGQPSQHFVQLDASPL